MGFTIKEGRVRVNFFKRSGKWAYEGAINMSPYYHEPLIHDAVKKALRDGIEGLVDSFEWWEFHTVVLKPYHEHSHPIMLTALEHSYKPIVAPANWPLG